MTESEGSVEELRKIQSTVEEVLKLIARNLSGYENSIDMGIKVLTEVIATVLGVISEDEETLLDNLALASKTIRHCAIEAMARKAILDESTKEK